MKKPGEINSSLPDLLTGILIFGAVAEFIPVWFVNDKAGYTIGLTIGIVTAMFVAWQMAWSLDRAFGYDEETATKRIQLVVLGILMITEVGNPLSAFLGMWSLKVAAYTAPFTHKLFRR